MDQQSLNKKTSFHFASLGKDLILYGIMAGFSSITGLLLLPLFTRAFSVEEFGALDIIVTFITLLGVVIRLSLAGSINRYFFAVEDDLDRNNLISTTILIVAIVGIGLTLLIGIFSESLSLILFKSPQYSLPLILGAFAASISALASLPQMVLRMERKIVRVNVVNALYSLAYAIMSLYLVYERDLGIFGVLLAMVLAATLRLTLASIWTRNHLILPKSQIWLTRTLRYSLPLLPGAAITWVNKQADRLVLLTLIGLSAVGVFGAAAKLVFIVGLPTTVFRSSWVPFSMRFVNLEILEKNDFYRRALNYFAGVFACLGLVITALAPELFRVWLPGEYQQGFVLVPWLAGATILRTSGDITRMGVLLSEKTLSVSFLAWASAIVNIILAIILVRLLGLTGAAIGSFVAALMFTGGLWYFSTRLSEIRFDGQKLLKILVIYVITSIFLLWVANTNQPFAFSIGLRMSILTIAVSLIAFIIIDDVLREAIRYLFSKLIDFSTRFPGRTYLH